MEEKLQFKNFLSVHQSPLKQKKTTYVFYLAIFNFNWCSSFLCPPRLRCLCLSLSLFSFSFVFSMWLFKHLNWGVCSFKFQHEGVFFLAASSAEEAAGVVCLEINRGRCFNKLFLYFLFYPLHFSLLFFLAGLLKIHYFEAFYQASLGSETTVEKKLIFKKDFFTLSLKIAPSLLFLFIRIINFCTAPSHDTAAAADW